MIIEGILNFVFWVLGKGIGMIPETVMNNDAFGLGEFVSLVSKAFVVFPLDLFQTCISHISGAMTLQIAWAVIEWIYKKVPGVD